MKRVKSLYKAYKNIIFNLSNLSILQLINILLPFIIMPYLIKVLGADLYGLIIFVQILITYFSVIINFGFDISATKQISINRTINFSLSRIVSSIISTKLFLFLCCIPVLLILYLSIPILQLHKKLFFFSCIILIADILNLVWYFQGIEKMKYLTYINLLSKSVSTLLVLVFINSEEDYFLIPLFLNGSMILGNIIGIIFILKNHNIDLKRTSLNNIFKEIKISFPFFFSKASSLILTKTNNLVLGLYVGYSSVAFYDVAEKIIGALIIPFNMLNQAIFPSVSVSKNMQFLKKIIIISFIISLIVYVLLIISSNFLLTLLGGIEFALNRHLLYVFGIVIIIINLIYLFSTSLIINGLVKEYSIAIILSMVIYLILLIGLWSLNIITIKNLILLKIGADLCTLIYLIYIIKNRLKF